MKAIVFFEGKEVCQVNYDRVAEFAGQLDFFMEKELIAYFAKGHSYLTSPVEIAWTDAEILEIEAKINHDTKKLNRRWWKL